MMVSFLSCGQLQQLRGNGGWPGSAVLKMPFAVGLGGTVEITLCPYDLLINGNFVDYLFLYG
ncbi:hypothetical protein [Andreprevotia sp. IGB-42]|uniref:hypothetical protein n=1 Tax=Andreprevotia sp. IGB-42 TaxID=2497473 RepID=UPI00135C0B6A|nr:hypothetical protein [Andreprevotia sp. IGB-42]